MPVTQRAPLLLIAAGVALVAGALAALALDDRPAEAGSSTVIDIVDFNFCSAGGTGCVSPYQVQVPTNSSVTWRWGAFGGGTSANHTVTECTDATFSSCPGTNFNGGPQKSGSLTFPVGSVDTTYYFHCNIHPCGASSSLALPQRQLLRHPPHLHL